MTSAFGQIVVATQVEYAVRDILRKYYPTYLREVERIMEWEREPLPTPRNYTKRNSFDAQAGEELPKIVVISPGLWQIPTHPESEGYYKAIWHVGVGVATAAQTEELADNMIQMYSAAARSILIEHQDLETDYVTAVYWLDENFDDLPGADDQLALYKSAGVFVGVETPRTVSRYIRPSQVTEAPQTLSTVEEVITGVRREGESSNGITVITH